VAGTPSWTGEKIRHLDDNGVNTFHSDNFGRDLSKCNEFEEYLNSHRTEFSEKAGGDEAKIRKAASEGFAIKHSQWNSYWRGKIAGGLTMALSIMRPKKVTTPELNHCGIRELCNKDYSRLHVAIAACIDGGPVTQEEQQTMATMVDEVVFDICRRGPAWAQNAAVLIVRFPDVESFVQSLDGERNLVRAPEAFKTRQNDKCFDPKSTSAVRLGL